MDLKKCLLTNNRCYKKNQLMNEITGIVVHSTGANNKTLKRYVQPSSGDKNKDKIIADIGKNKYGNSWNNAIVSKCVHAFIGINEAGKVVTYQTLPFNVCCWGVGKGKKGSYNYNPQARIQFEICEDALKDEAYFNDVFQEAAEFCAYLCDMFGLKVKNICSHAEAHKDGYGSDHSDCDHWLKKFGKNMDWFRGKVDAILNDNEEEKTVTIEMPVLKKGSKADEVKTLQILLSALGYDIGKSGVDGSLGGATEKAVRAFQSDHKLEADGSVGKATWTALLKG